MAIHSRIFHRLTRCITSALFLWATTSLAHSEDTALKNVQALQLVNLWYAQLANTPADLNDLSLRTKTLQSITADNAQIILEDLGITQTRDEFIESLEGYFDALEGGGLAWRPDTSTTSGDLTMMVCYNFVGNAMMTAETFQIENGLIQRSTQKQLADNCDKL